MNYKETIQYLFSALPMYQRIGQAAMKKDLTNIILLCELLDNPHLKFKSVHIAGTNGKGSVVHILASILQEAGYKVGCYTSPHYRDFRERIKINGEFIPEEEVSAFVEQRKQTFEMIEPSFFEITVAMAFDYFARKEVDIALIETGLGGRLDSTNVLHPLLTVITNISLDHQSFLGDNIESIATEKAGIIKQHTPVVIGETEELSKKVFENTALLQNAPIYFADQIHTIHRKNSSQLFDVYYENAMFIEQIESDLGGRYQDKNIATTLQAAFLMVRAGFKIDKESIRKGLLKVRENTGFIGRFEIVQDHPKVIMDSAHNEAGIRELFEEIGLLKYNHLHIVYGTVQDKDWSKMLGIMPRNASYYFCRPDIPRGLDAESLFDAASELKLLRNRYKNVTEAYSAALERAGRDDLVLVTGSIFIVAEIV